MNAYNETFKHDDCNITIRFTPADKYGVNRHTIIISRHMCKPLKEQCFKENIDGIRDYAKSLTCFVRTICG